MEFNTVTVVIITLVSFILLRMAVRRWLISRMLRQSYQQKLNRVLSDPESRPKGRFE